MITTAEEYNNNLLAIQNQKFPQKTALLLPSTETVFAVDWNNRTIAAPQFLSVEKDHIAEAIYFKMARFVETVDLSECVGVIQYINAAGESYLYPIPYYDIETYKEKDQMIVQWNITNSVAKKAGTVQYSIRFYKMSEDGKLVYNISTQPNKSKILYGLDIDKNGDFAYADDSLGPILEAIHQLSQIIAGSPEIPVNPGTGSIDWIDV